MVFVLQKTLQNKEFRPLARHLSLILEDSVISFVCGCDSLKPAVGRWLPETSTPTMWVQGMDTFKVLVVVFT